jgi:hypothetical protein
MAVASELLKGQLGSMWFRPETSACAWPMAGHVCLGHAEASECTEGRDPSVQGQRTMRTCPHLQRAAEGEGQRPGASANLLLGSHSHSADHESEPCSRTPWKRTRASQQLRRRMADQQQQHSTWAGAARAPQRIASRGLTRAALLTASRLSVASSSVWPPDRNMMPGMAGGTTLRSAAGEPRQESAHQDTQVLLEAVLG